MAVEVYRYRKARNVTRSKLYVHSESGSPSSKTLRPYAQFIDFFKKLSLELRVHRMRIMGTYRSQQGLLGK
jgi:hypothetical protein